MKWSLTLFVLAGPVIVMRWRHQSCVWVWQEEIAGGELLACNHSPVRFVIIERCLLCEECSQPATPVQTLRPGIHHGIAGNHKVLFITKYPSYLTSPFSQFLPQFRAVENCYGAALTQPWLSPGQCGVRCEVWLMGPLIPVSGVCLVLIVLSVVSALSDPGHRQTDPGGAGGWQSDRVTVCWLSVVWLVTTFIPLTAGFHNCSTLNYNSIEPNEDIRYYIAITTKERIFHHNKPPVMSNF